MAGRSLLSGLRIVSVHEILCLLESGAAISVRDLVVQLDEDQGAASANFERYVHNPCRACYMIADPQWTPKIDSAGGPHASAQGYRRQEAAEGRVTVATNIRKPANSWKVQPMEQRRQYLTAAKLKAFSVESRGEQ